MKILIIYIIVAVLGYAIRYVGIQSIKKRDVILECRSKFWYYTMPCMPFLNIFCIIYGSALFYMASKLTDEEIFDIMDDATDYYKKIKKHYKARP
ncbi:MAG: hypothetical protein ACI4C1_10395 [Lachnospiraceae bacterium]